MTPDPAATNRCQTLRELCSQTAAAVPPDFFSQFDAVILAVSGGVDSMLLLSVFLCLRESGILPRGFEVFHLNHMIREDSPEDEKLISSVCSASDVKYTIFKKNIKKIAFRLKKGTEETGRILRYRLMQKMAAERGRTLLVTAHHSDDYAESVIFFMIRGAGRSVFDTMPLISVYAGYSVFRPFLLSAGSDLLKTASAAGLSWNEDSTNAETGYTRNRIRHNIMPLLRKEGFSSAMLWKNHHSSSDLVLPGEGIRSDLIHLPSVFFEGVSLSGLKTALDLALKRAGFPPCGRDLLHEISRQLLASGSFAAETALYYLWFRRRGGFFLISRSSPALQLPEWETTISDEENTIRIKIIYNEKQRNYHYTGKAGDFTAGIPEAGSKACTVTGGRNLSDVLSQEGFPPAVRGRVPVIRNRDGCVVRICGSLFDGRADRIFPD